MSTILYHYTDFHALNGILCDRELRVNNVLNMNDAEEMQLFMRGIFSAVQQRLEAGGELEKAWQLQKMYETLKKDCFEYSAYAACFSSYRDDAAQWERYANRGTGVCLGMRREILQKMTGGAISMQQVFYQDDMKTHPLVGIIHDLVLESSEFSENNTALWDRVREAWRNSASFKHPSFSSEHEIRLVVMPFNAEDFDVKPRYHVARERIKKFYPLNLDIMCRKANVTIEELISEIIIGPQSTQSLPILQDYLRDLSFEELATHVCLSDCPLR